MPRHSFVPLEGRIEEIVVASDALRGNLCGDPVERRVAVHLPPGTERGRHPVLVDLVGFTGSGYTHLGFKAFQETVPQRVERLIREGRMPPVVTVFPDCFTSVGGNQYVNSAALGRWADFLLDDLMPAIEARFPVLPGPAHRGVFGKSSGGYGAIVHGLRYGDRWGAVACHSGDMGFEWCYKPHFPKTVETIARHGGVAEFVAHFDAAPRVLDADFEALMTLAMGATYDPDLTAPRGLSIPVDLRTCALDEPAWRRWLAHDPVVLIEDPACQARLRGLRGLYVDCGTRDQYALLWGARQLGGRLEALGIPHRYEEFDDTHSAVDYRMDVSLPILAAALTATTPPTAPGG